MRYLTRLLKFDWIPKDVMTLIGESVSDITDVVDGETDPDTPYESMQAVFARIEARAATVAPERFNTLARHFAGVGRFLDERPDARSFLKAQAVRTWRGLLSSMRDEDSAIIRYAADVQSAWPGAPLIALGYLRSLTQQGQEDLVQASGFLKEARARTGEARFTSAKQLANVLLTRLYPRYAEALAVLETIRTGSDIVKNATQRENFGTVVHAVGRSLPTTAAQAFDREAHRFRNAVEHGAVQRSPQNDVVELGDRNGWRWSGTTPQLVDRLEKMLNQHMEATAAFLLVTGDFIFELVKHNVTWRGFRAGTDELGPAFAAAAQRTLERALLWPGSRPPAMGMTKPFVEGSN